MKRGSNTRRTHSPPLCVSLRLLGNYSADDSLWYSCLNLSSGINFLLEAFLCFYVFLFHISALVNIFKSQFGLFGFLTIILYLINWFLKVLLFLVSAALHFKSNRHKFYLNQFIFINIVFFSVSSLPVAVGQCRTLLCWQFIYIGPHTVDTPTQTKLSGAWPLCPCPAASGLKSCANGNKTIKNRRMCCFRFCPPSGHAQNSLLPSS